MQVLQRRQVGGDVLSYGGVRTPAGLDGADAGRGESPVPRQELGVFAREDVVCDGGDGVFLAEGEAELKHEGGFARADGAVGETMSIYGVVEMCGGGDGLELEKRDDER